MALGSPHGVTATLCPSALRVRGPKVCPTWSVKETCVNLMAFFPQQQAQLFTCALGFGKQFEVILDCFTSVIFHVSENVVVFSCLQMPSRCRNALNIAVTTLFAVVVLFTILLAYVTG